MAHRVEPYPTSRTRPYHPSANHHRSSYENLTSHSGASTPSASSIDRSAVSSPAPHTPPTNYEMPRSYSVPTGPGYMYGGYHAEKQYSQQDYPYAAPEGFPGEHPTGYAPYPYPPPQNGGTVIQVVFTSDAATKLNDRVKRRCFNCAMTDTSTWRRSSLSPGKILCNRCGLYERTHLRTRPQKFSHKRGSSGLHAHSLPSTAPKVQSQATALPPNKKSPYMASLSMPASTVAGLPSAEQSKIDDAARKCDQQGHEAGAGDT